MNADINEAITGSITGAPVVKCDRCLRAAYVEQAP